jgi:hypothetical protein
MRIYPTLQLYAELVTYRSAHRKISPQVTESDTKTDYDYIIPVVDPSSLDLRCGRNASTAWSNPKTAVIRAGDTVGFAVNTTVGLPIAGAPVLPWDVRARISFFPVEGQLPLLSMRSTSFRSRAHCVS